MLCFWCFFTRNSLDHHGASGGARTSTPHLMIPWNSLRWCIGSVLLGVAKALPPAHTPHTKKRSHVHRKFHLPNGIVYSMIHQSCWWIVTPKKKKLQGRWWVFRAPPPTSPPPRQRQHILQEVQVDLHLGIWESTIFVILFSKIFETFEAVKIQHLVVGRDFSTGSQWISTVRSSNIPMLLWLNGIGTMFQRTWQNPCDFSVFSPHNHREEKTHQYQSLFLAVLRSVFSSFRSS